jgi:GDSL-like Lipase/Acylhydrolase family
MRLTVRAFVFIFIAIVLSSPVRFAYAAQPFDSFATVGAAVQQAVTALTHSSQPAPAAPTSQELRLRSDLRDARSAQITSVIADTARAFVTAAHAELQQLSQALSQTASAWSAFASLASADLISKLSIVTTPSLAPPTIAAAVANAPPATAISASALPTPRLATDTGALSGQSNTSFPLAAGTLLGASADGNDYVTQDELAALSNNLRSLIYSVAASSTTAFTDPQIAADGNGVYYGEAAAPVTQLPASYLSGLTASQIPALNYLSTLGGTLAGALADTATTSSYFLGSLGIGTTSPSAPLELYGSNSSTNLVTGGGIFEAITNADQTAGNFDSLSYREVNSAGLEVTGTRISGVFNSHTAGAESADLAFLTRNSGVLSEKLRITGAGNVGIGTTSPFATLSVAGSAYLTGSLNVGDASTTRNNLGLRYAVSADFTPGIATWGDSLTQGAGYNYPDELSVLTGVPVYNAGISGQSAAQIAAQMLAAPQYDSWPTIIWAGRNDISGVLSTDEPNILSNIASMVAALTSSNYIILSIPNANTEPSGSTNYNEIIAINAALASTYGSHYLDEREYLVTNGLSLAGITPSAQDLTDISNDVPPADLRADFEHPNATGNWVIAQYIYQNITLLIPTTSSTPIITTKNLISYIENPPTFPLLNTQMGYAQNDTTILFASSANQNTLVGDGAGQNLPTTTISLAASYNTAIGYQALNIATSSSGNTAVGRLALQVDTSGSVNVAVG